MRRARGAELSVKREADGAAWLQTASTNDDERVACGACIIKSVHIKRFSIASLAIAFLWLAYNAFAVRKITRICSSIVMASFAVAFAIAFTCRRATLQHDMLFGRRAHLVSIHVVGVVEWSNILHLVWHMLV